MANITSNASYETLFEVTSQSSGIHKLLYLSFAATLGIVVWILWTYVVRLVLLRRFYEKQGIRFVDKCYAVVGAEMRVSGLQVKNKSHDWLYTERPTDIHGTVRGFSLQLYCTSAEFCEELIAKTGFHVDRDTPALFSFGRLSPYALTFLPINKWRFRERKVTLTKGMRDNKRLFDIVSRQAEEALTRFRVKNGSGITINIRELLNHWTRESSGEFIWGRSNIQRQLTVKDTAGNLVTLPSMTALNQTFTELRFYASRFWNRVYFPLAALPLTKESRRLSYNIEVLVKATEEMMRTPEEETVASLVQEFNDELGIPITMTRDDLVTATIAGLDTIKSSVMGTLFHLLEPENLYWKKQLLDEINELKQQPGNMFVKLSHAPKLNAFILETLRYEPPGSLINNAAVKDFNLSVKNMSYKIKSGTRIVTCIHALHQNEESWAQRVNPNMAPLNVFDPSRFLDKTETITRSYCFMPFGKGPRRCPGQGAGLMMVKVFIAAFLTNNFNCRMAVPENQTKDITWFNIYSKATFDVICNDEN
ncbi:cytochrome P450 [Xylaria bambusicola]|uniref:cytochrome P450 n=1 Tax=Xylaria bambusicola TaxID=326684 RepID=UPI002008AE30|nr:cytochrome P450 [Xylaria bambusicola]KAI0517018.1 cytochrome P450 [Xylaria bambusicola]